MTARFSLALPCADILAEHTLSQRLRQADLDGFAAKGVPALALARSASGDYAFIGRDRVLFDASGRFEFVRYRRDTSGAVNSYVLPLLDESGGPADLMAFRPGGPAATWLGRCGVAGAEQILRPRFDEPLPVHPDIMTWLRSDRVGVVILDVGLAAEQLHGHTLGVATQEHARRLRVALARAAPPIVVARHVELAA